MFKRLEEAGLGFHPLDMAVHAIRTQPARDQLGIERIVLQMKNPGLATHRCGRTERIGGTFKAVQKWLIAWRVSTKDVNSTGFTT